MEASEHREDAADPWHEVGVRWARVAEGIREHYRAVADDGGPTEGEVRDALATLGEAGRRLVDSIGSALRDPEMREQVRTGAASFVSALGATFSELGVELRRDEPARDENPRGR